MAVRTGLPDRRIQKTHNLLREALHALIRDKSYESITVTGILDRANVGRSTFYAHFRDKDELLVSGIHEILRAVHAPTAPFGASTSHDPVLWFSLPIFEYHYRHRRASDAKMGIRGRAILHAHLRKVIVELLAADVERGHQHRRRQTAGQIPADLQLQHVASTFILVLNWWFDSKSSLRPQEVNDVFRSLVLPALAGE